MYINYHRKLFIKSSLPVYNGLLLSKLELRLKLKL